MPRLSCRMAARMRRRQGGGHELSSATASCARTRGSAAASLSSEHACGVCLASGRMADESEGRGAARDAQVLSEFTQLCGVARHRARSKSSVRRGDDRLDESPAAARTFRSERVDVGAGQQAVSEAADVDDKSGECMRRGRLERLQRRRRRAIAVEPSFEHRRLRGSRDSTFLIWQVQYEYSYWLNSGSDDRQPDQVRAGSVAAWRGRSGARAPPTRRAAIAHYRHTIAHGGAGPAPVGAGGRRALPVSFTSRRTSSASARPAPCGGVAGRP